MKPGLQRWLTDVRWLPARHPVLLPATALGMGVLLANEANTLWLLGGCWAGVVLGLSLRALRRLAPLRNLLLVLGLCFALGTWRGDGLFTPAVDDISSLAPGRVKLLAVNLENTRFDRVGALTTLTVMAVQANGQLWPASGKVQVRLFGGQVDAMPPPGHRLSLTAKLKPLPDTSAYQRYLHRQHIHCTATASRIKALGPAGGWAHLRWRNAMANALQRSLPNPEAAETAVALLLGIQVGLPQELKQAYKDSGIAHVLVLSGQHITTLLLVLQVVLLGLGALGLGRVPQVLLALGLVWAYAVVTALEPSIARAAIMGSLLLLPRLLLERYSPINALAVAFFVQLLVFPEHLFHLGFQFSYAAVLGIVLGTRWLNTWLPRPKASAFRFFHEAVSVSLCAQLGLLPLQLYHLHTFPTWFLVANVGVALLALLATVGCFFLLPLAIFWPQAALWLGWPLEWLLVGMNRLAAEVATWPGAVLQDLNIGLPGALVLAAVLVVLFTWRRRHEALPESPRNLWGN